MSRTLSTLLAASALTLWGSAAYAQVMTATPSTVPLTYAKGSGTATSGTSVITADTDGTTYTAISPSTWLTSTPGTGTANTSGTGGDTLTLAIVTSVADHMAAGMYSAVVPIVGGTTSASVTVNLTITSGTSPLSSSPTSISFTYILSGVANQSGIHSTTSTISSNDTLADTYTVNSPPAWLTVTPTASHAAIGSTDTLTFGVVQSAANSLSAGPNTFTVKLSVTGQQDLSIVVTITVVAAQPLVSASTPSFGYTIGGSVPSAQNAIITVASGSQAFALDPATLPIWLTSTATGTANSSPGATIVLTPVSAVIKGMATGNYSASIGFEATYAQSELHIPVVLTISNPTATLSIKGATTNPSILPMPGSAVPAPVITVISSDEPTGFSATCAVTTTNPTYVPITTTCQLSGASAPGSTVTGIAYTFGTPLTTTFDSNLFSASTPFGTVVTLTVTVTGGAGSAVHQTYAYTIQPIAPTFTALSPTSANQIASGDSLVINLTGTNFVGPGSIVTGSSLSPTRVFVNGTDLTANAVVFNSTSMAVSVPQTSFLSFPSGKTTVNLPIGVANQTGASAPTAATVSQNLVITTAPVIYAVTSTASYKQPAPGAKPGVAPYELVSIFGANFGATAGVSGTLNAFAQFGNTVNISGLGTTLSPFVTLSVTFKVGATSYPAPILFANATQINAAVPSGMTVGSNATVTVTSGTLSSDGLFGVTVVAADPGIFTLSSQGVGQGAILNQDNSVNQPGNPAAAGDIVAIYMTGLGAPNSTAVDATTNTGGYPAGCVQISNTGTGTPGYLQVVNTKVTGVYTPPTPAWTNIDGAVILGSKLLGSGLPPCFTGVTATAISVTFGSTTVTGSSNVTYAGFGGGSVAGLYQVNVKVPSGLTTGNVPVKVTIGTEGTSPAGVVTMAVH